MKIRIALQDSAAVELNGELYVIGGTDALIFPEKSTMTIRFHYSNVVNQFELVQKYDPIAKVWTEVGCLQEGRLLPAARVCNGQIYVIGGFRNNLETYNPSKNSWNYVNNLILSPSQVKAKFIPCD